MAQIVAFSCFFVYVYNDVELDYADTELTPRSTSPLTMFVSFIQIMAEKLGQKFGRSALQQKEIPCLWKKSSLFMTFHSR